MKMALWVATTLLFLSISINVWQEMRYRHATEDRWEYCAGPSGWPLMFDKRTGDLYVLDMKSMSWLKCASADNLRTSALDELVPRTGR